MNFIFCIKSWLKDAAWILLFIRPQIVVILVRITNGKLLHLTTDGYTITDETSAADFISLVDRKIFGKEQQWLFRDSSGIEGSEFADEVHKSRAGIDVTTELVPLRQEISDLYKITKTVSS